MEAPPWTGAPCVSKCYFGKFSMHGLIHRHTKAEKESLGMSHLLMPKHCGNPCINHAGRAGGA